MAKKLLTAMLVMLGIACWGLSTDTYSALFTLDTIDPEITLIAPNGGEDWYIGETQNILWTVTETNLTTNSIYLWYSLNAGTDYITLAEAIANSGSYAWQIPDYQSFNAKVKVQATDDFGNQGEISSASVFSLIFAPPEAPGNVNVDISNNVSAIITWDPVTQTILGTPITPDGYIVLYNESPYEENEHFFYYLWDVTSGTSFTHVGVAQHRDQMYYRVVAYKDYEGRMAAILEAARNNPESKLSLADLKAGFLSGLGGEK